MDFYELMNTVDQSVEQFIEDETELVEAELIGLDRRAAYGGLRICEDCIVALKSQDKNLQYYGGFEYIEQEYRSVMGGYVFYSGEDERVQEHIQKWLESK